MWQQLTQKWISSIGGARASKEVATGQLIHEILLDIGKTLAFGGICEEPRSLPGCSGCWSCHLLIQEVKEDIELMVGDKAIYKLCDNFCSGTLDMGTVHVC